MLSDIKTRYLDVERAYGITVNTAKTCFINEIDKFCAVFTIYCGLLLTKNIASVI